MADSSAHELLERRAERSVEETIERLRRDTVQKAHEVRLPAYARKIVEQVDRGYFQGRKLWIVGPHRFPPEMRAFLPILLLDDACDHPRLRDKLAEYGRCIAANYPWVWCMSPVTLPLRMQARDLLLREGESGFGETPLAGAMAFIRYHHRMMQLDTLTDFGVLYNKAYSLELSGFFKNRDVDRTTQFEQFKEHPEEQEEKPELRIAVPRGSRPGRSATDGNGQPQ
jgi:hypothetical protein